MIKYLLQLGREQKYTARDKEGVTRVYDINLAMIRITQGDYAVESVSPTLLTSAGRILETYHRFNVEYAMNTDISSDNPAIMIMVDPPESLKATLPEGTRVGKIIDGWHRLFKCLYLGEKFHFITLSPEDTAECMIAQYGPEDVIPEFLDPRIVPAKR